MNSSSQIQALKKDALSFAASTDDFATEVLGAQSATQDEKLRIALLAQAIRMLRGYQAIVVLVTENLNDSAAAVLRSVLEQHYVFTALVIDGDKLSRAARDEQGEKRKAINGLRSLSLSDRPPEMTNEVLDAALSEYDEPSGFNVQFWAQAAGMDGSYRTFYRSLSSFSHGALATINNYLDMDEHGNVRQIKSQVGAVESIQYVLLGAGFLLDATKVLNQSPGTELQRARFDYLVDTQNSLYQRFFQIDS